MKRELATMTGMGTCKVCGAHKVKRLKTTYLDGSMHFVDENNKSWNASTCPSCYSERRKLKRRVHKPEHKSCEQCNKSFVTKMKLQRFCSKSCQKRFNNDKRVLVDDTSKKD